MGEDGDDHGRTRRRRDAPPVFRIGAAGRRALPAAGLGALAADRELPRHRDAMGGGGPAAALATRRGRRAGVLLLLGLPAALPPSALAMPGPEGITGRGGDRHAGEVRRASAAGGRMASSGRRPFEGFWAADPAGCADPDSAGRMAIEADAIQWYETRCRIAALSPAGRSAWHLGLDCRGEGQHIAARATVRLPAPDILTIENGPIGPERRQRYIRCRPR